MRYFIFRKNLAKLYSTALTEGVSKGFRELIKQNFNGVIDNNLKVYMMLTDNDYERVESCEEIDIKKVKDKFIKAKSQLA